jgi:hypothetical protein
LVQEQPNNDTKPQTQYHEPTEAEMTEDINARLTLEEKEYYDSFTSIISKLQLPDNVKLVKDNNLSSFIRSAMAFMSNSYVGSIFMDSNLVSRLPDKQAKREFLAFRTKYMNIPINAQLQDLKRLGLVKPKEK